MPNLPSLVAVAALVLSGCTHSPGHRASPSHATPSCKAKDNTADCHIQVDISMPTDSTCTVAVIPSQFTVGFEKSAKDKWVDWILTDSSPEGASFTRTGIAPKGDATVWNANFKNGGTSHGGRQFKWKNQNDASQAGTDYAYAVNVEVSRQGRPTVSCTQDPILRNQR